MHFVYASENIREAVMKTIYIPKTSFFFAQIYQPKLENTITCHIKIEKPI